MNKNIKEWRTIEGLQVDKDWLQQENDSLRAQVLQAPDAKLVAFMAAFELWLEVEKEEFKDALCEEYDDHTCGWHDALVDQIEKWHKIKAQHLGDDSEGE